MIGNRETAVAAVTVEDGNDDAAGSSDVVDSASGDNLADNGGTNDSTDCGSTDPDSDRSDQRATGEGGDRNGSQRSGDECEIERRKNTRNIGQMNACKDHTIRICDWCCRSFRHRKNFENHVISCDGRRFSKNTVERACEIAMSLVYQGDTSRGAIYSANGNNPYIAEMNTDDVVLNRKITQGWATRPGSGKVLGTNTTNRYVNLIKRWFEEGYKDKTKRRSPAMMLRMLTAMFPTHYDLPTEQHLKNKVNALLRAQKKLESQQESTSTGNILSMSASVGAAQDVGTETTFGHNEMSTNETRVLSEITPVQTERLQDRPVSNASREVGAGGGRESPEGSYGRVRERSSEGGPSSSLQESMEPTEAVERPKKRGRKPNSKPMNSLYANAILALMGENPNVRRRDIYHMLIAKLSLDVNRLPVDFPSKDQVNTKVTNFKRAAPVLDSGSKRRRME